MAIVKPTTIRSSHRSAAWTVFLVLAVYCAGFFALYPSVITVSDEASYLRQAAAFADGRLVVREINPLTNGEVYTRPSNYPIGTSAVMALFIKLWGLKGAFLVPLTSLILTTLCLTRWLLASGRNPAYTLLLFFYPPTLFMGRVAMSDMASAAIVTAALWLFWTACEKSAFRSAVAGFLAGLSIMLRETNPVIFLPFFIGSFIRRDKQRWHVGIGFFMGLAMRPITSALIFGDPLFTNSVRAPFSLSAVPQNMLGGLVLLQLLFAGLFLVPLYRGIRYPEVLTAIFGFLALYAFYGYSGAESGLLKGAVLGGRFYLPILPLIVFACAEVLAQGRKILQGCYRSWLAPSKWRLVWVPWTLAAAACCSSVAVHVLLTRWSLSRATLREAIYYFTPAQAAIVTDRPATEKFINELYGVRYLVDISSGQFGVAQARRLLTSQGRFYVVLVDRFDSEFWRRRSAGNRVVVDSLIDQFCVIQLAARQPTQMERLTIWRVERPLHDVLEDPCLMASGKGRCGS